jgi:type II secretory pathway predicted ATPase ExeA
MQDKVATGDSPRSRSLFKPTSWLAQIDFINQLVLFNNVLITVISEKSGGGSSFGSLLLKNLDQQVKSVFIEASPACQAREIIAGFSAQLNLNQEVVLNMPAIVEHVTQSKTHVLLVIDEAQHLPEELLRDFLMAIKSQNEIGFFHLCLISDNSIVKSLKNCVANECENLVHTIELGALNESEMRTYVLQRAMAAGLINKPLSDSQFKALYQLTRGNIAKINHHLEPFIIKCTEKKELTANKAFIKRAGLAVCAVALCSSLSYIYFFHTQPTIASSKEILTTSLPSINQTMIEQSDSVAHEEIQVSYVSSYLDDSVIQLVQNALPKKQVLDLPEEEQNNSTVALVDRVIIIPSIPKKELAKVVVHAHRTTTTFVHERQKLATKIVAHSASKKSVKIINKAIARSPNFTIQLVASHRKSDLERFKRNNKMAATAKIRQLTNGQGSWYVLTLGEFNTRGEALNKVNNLPVTLAKFNPWIRPVASLKSVG